LNILKLFKNIFKLKNYSKDEGFTFFEFVIVVSLLGITTSLFLPIFKNLTNKSKQKEATLIVSSIIKSAKSSYGIYSYLPNKMGELSKFAKFQKCIENNVEKEGSLVCKNDNSVKTQKNDKSFFSPTGNYKIEIKQESSNLKGEMFLVKANPNGSVFSKEGSAVIGCYSPTSGISLIKNYSSKKSERGIKEYIECGNKSKKPPVDPCLLNPKDPNCIQPPKPPVDPCLLNPKDPNCIQPPKPPVDPCLLNPKDPNCIQPPKPPIKKNLKPKSDSNIKENFDQNSRGFSEGSTENKNIQTDDKLETINDSSEKDGSIDFIQSESLLQKLNVLNKSEDNNSSKVSSTDDDNDDGLNPIPPWIR